MPTYDYQCRSCGHTVEVIHSMTEQGPATCARCGGELRRVLYPTGIIFKGSGFYKTDSRAAASSSSSTSKPAEKVAPKGDSAPTAPGDTSSAPAPAPGAAKESAGSQ